MSQQNKNILNWLKYAPMLSGALLLSVLVALFAVTGAQASGPSSNRVLNYQLRLTDASGIPVADGTKSVKLTFFTASSGGTQLYTACSADGSATGTPTAVTVTFTNGAASVLIGDTGITCASGTAVAIPATLFDNVAMYLGVTVNADAEMTPRKRIVATGYALNADRLDDLDTSAAGGSNAFVPVTDSSGNFTLTKNVTVDTDTFFVDATNDRVGIGMTSPSGTKVHIVGGNDAHSTNGIRLSSTTGATSEYGFIDPDSTTDYLRLGYWNGSTFGNTVIDQGRLGIGTASPQTSLHIQTSGGGTIRLNDTTNTGNVNTIAAPSSNALRFSTVGSHEFIINSDNAASSGDYFSVWNVNQSGTPLLAIQSSTSYAGINTSSPEARLHVEDSTNSNAAIEEMTLRRSRADATAPGAADFGGDLTYRLEGFTNNSSVLAGRVRGAWEAAQTNDTTDRDSYLSFATMANNSLAEAMRISSAGNVGIGDASPASLLTVGSGDRFNVNSLGDVTSTFAALDGTDLANGAGTNATTLVLDDTTGFNAGNYVLVNSTYAKIVSVDSATNLTISPALTWADNATVDEYHVPEVGGTDTASTLANRYGRGYFIDGVVTGNGSTRFTDNLIDTTANTLNFNTTNNRPVTFGTGAVTAGGNLVVTGTITSNSTSNSVLNGPLALANISGSDPTGTNGLTYYNTTSNKFRCYQNGAWTDCIGTGGSGMSIGGTVTSATAGSVLFANAGPVLAQDNANFYWDDTNNRLGLGTASPAAWLEVEDAANSNSALELASLHRSRADSTAPGAADFGGDLTWRLESATDNSDVIAAKIRGAWDKAQTNDTTERDGYLGFFTMDSNSLSERMRLDPSGRLGLGTGASINSNSGIHVNNGFSEIRLTGTGNAFSDISVTLENTTVTTGRTWLMYSSGNDSKFYIDKPGSEGAFTINDSRQVGIGTTSPSNQLTVSGNTDITGNLGVGVTTALAKLHVRNGSPGGDPSDPNMVALFDSSGNATNLYVNMKTSGSGGTNSAIAFAVAGTVQHGINYNIAGDRLALTNSLVADPTTGVIIDASGNVGIGDNTPSALLDVGGTFAVQGNSTVGDASGDTVTSNAAAWTFVNDTAVTLSGGVNGINFDANTLSIDATNNRVGIGTAAPFFGDLMVEKNVAGGLGGDIWISNNATNTVGSYSRLAFAASADTDSIPGAGIEGYLTSTSPLKGELVFKVYDGVGYNEKLRLKNAATTGDMYLTMGSTIPANGQKLLMYESGNTKSGIGIVSFVQRLFTDSTSSLSFGQVSTSDGSTYDENMRVDANGDISVHDGTLTTDGQFSIRQDAAADIFNLYDGATNVVTVVDGGKMGIGTSNPFNGQLHVNASNGSGLGGDMWITNSGTVGVGSAARLAFGADATTDSVANAGIENIITNAGTLTSDLVFKIYDGSAYNEKMRLTSAGMLTLSGGLVTPFTFTGTATESVGHLIVSRTNAGGLGGQLTIRNTGSTTSTAAAIAFELDGTAAFNTGTGAADSNAEIRAVINNGTNDATDLIFTNWTGSAEVETMRLLSSGNVGIGDASPAALFTVGNGDDFQVSSIGAISTTIADAANAVGLTVTQNDTTNNPRGVSLVNAGTAATLFIDPNGNTSTSTSVGGALLLENTGNTGSGMVIYSNQATPASGANLLAIRADNATFDKNVMAISNDGTGLALSINSTGGTGGGISVSAAGTTDHTISASYSGTTASIGAGSFVSTNPNFTAFQVTGHELAHGTIKASHVYDGTSDANAAVLSLDRQGVGTAAQGIFIDSTASGGSTGKILNLRNAGVEYLTLNSTGMLGLSTSSPKEILDVAGGARFGLAPTTLTTLNGAITDTDTTITVASTTNYPQAGTLIIDNELMYYTGTTATTFTGVTRARLNTIAVAHASGTTVNNLLTSVVNGQGSTPNMVMTGAGYLGLGLSTPGEMLTVAAGNSAIINAGHLTTAFAGFGRFENYVTYSEQFNNAAWTKESTIAVTTNADPGPDGTATAERVSTGGAGSTDGITQAASGAPATASTTWTATVWMKVTSGTHPVGLRISSGNETGTAVTYVPSTTWKRFNVTQAFTSGSTGTATFRIETGVETNVVLWGAQLEKQTTTSTNSYPGTYARTVGTALTTTQRGLFAQSAIIDGDIQFQSSQTARNLKILTETANNAGDGLILTAGAAGTTTGAGLAGGTLTLNAGASTAATSGAGATGGAVAISATNGTAAATSGAGGAGGSITFTAGNGANSAGSSVSSGAGGGFTFTPGTGAANGGGGAGSSAGNGGNFTFSGQAGGSGSSSATTTGTGSGFFVTLGAGGANSGGSPATGGNGGAFTITGGTGGASSASTAAGGVGSAFSFTTGQGGANTGTAAGSGAGGAGGAFTINTGNGGAAGSSSQTGVGGASGAMTLQLGTGGTGSPTGNGGAGGTFTLLGAAGGASGATSGTGGAGGALSLAAGVGGNGTTTGGAGGAVTIAGANAGTGGNANGGSVTVNTGTKTGTGTNGTLNLQVAGTTRIMVDSDGQVRLGTNASGAGDVIVGTGKILQFNNAADDIGFQMYNAGGSGVADLALRPGGNERFRFTSAGEFIIGQTTTADDLLHVYGGSAGTVTADAAARVVIEDDANAYVNFLVPSANESGLVFGQNTTAVDGAIIYTTGDELRFRTNGNANRVIMDSAGHLSVQTLASATASSVCYDTTTISGFNTLSTCSSSLRYKEDVHDLAFDMGKLLQLRPVDFKWKNRDERSVGFIAEEVANLIPEVITYKDGQIEGIEYKLLTAYLVGAIKDHEARIQALKGAVELGDDGAMRVANLVVDSVAVRQTDALKTISKGTILSGSSAAVVSNLAVKENSEIFVTFKKNPGSAWWIDETHNGSFILKTAQPVSEDVAFTYWIVDVVDETTPPPPSQTPEPAPEEVPVPVTQEDAQGGTPTAGANEPAPSEPEAPAPTGDQPSEPPPTTP